MATPWLRGTVREVPSGDTLVVAGPSKGGPPPTKRITLASLIAPRLVKQPRSSVARTCSWLKVSISKPPAVLLWLANLSAADVLSDLPPGAKRWVFPG